VGKREKERVRETKNRKRRNGRLPRLERGLFESDEQKIASRSTDF
jgi:hypothetical protein